MFRQKEIKPDGKGVLVTGCSSGIGWALAGHLARGGFTVFATVRKEADAQALRSLNEPNLAPVCPLDLTRRDQIPAVVEEVTTKLRARGQTGLHALINSAGGGSIAPVELLDLEALRAELEARVVGSVALVQAFLPLLRQARGRIAWIMTPALMPTPYVTSVHACDFAVNCVARTLALELKPWGLASILIRCGGIRTPAVARTYAELDAAWATWPPERAALYAQALRRWREEMVAFDTQRTHPEAVARVVFRALCARQPKPRYAVGHMARAAAFLEALPQPWADALLARRF